MFVVWNSSVVSARVSNHDPFTTLLFFYIFLIFIPIFRFSLFLGFIVVSWLFHFGKTRCQFVWWPFRLRIFLSLLFLECEHFIGLHVWVHGLLCTSNLYLVPIIILPRIELFWVVLLSIWIWWIQLIQIVSLTWLEVNWKLLLTWMFIIYNLEIILKDIR